MNEVGRPTVMTDEVIRILEEAFSNDATDEQACFLANISPSSLYKFQEENTVKLLKKIVYKFLKRIILKKILKVLSWKTKN